MAAGCNPGYPDFWRFNIVKIAVHTELIIGNLVFTDKSLYFKSFIGNLN